jgi:bacterial/archaeal transporter family protein
MTMNGWILPAIVALVLWGIVGILQKLGSTRLGANALLFWVTAGYIAMLPVVLWRSGSWGASVDTLLLGVVAGSVNGLGTWLLFRSLEHGAKASVAVPLTALYPVVTVVLAFVFLAERLSLREWLGVALAVCGGALLSYEGEPPVTEE